MELFTAGVIARMLFISIAVVTLIYTLSDISSEKTFYIKLLLERHLELAAENNRWFDLIRTDRFVAELGNGFLGPYSSPSGDNATLIPMHAKPFLQSLSHS